MILREHRFPEQYRCEDTKFVFKCYPRIWIPKHPVAIRGSSRSVL